MAAPAEDVTLILRHTGGNRGKRLLDAVTKAMRRHAKAINFGLMYGMSAFGLGRQLGIPRSEAQAYVDLYFERYPGVKTFMDDIREKARSDGFVDNTGEGEDFGEIATELSTDTGSAANAGALPCGSPDGYVEPFRLAVLDATIGEVYPEVVESQFGFHVILVTELTEPTEADLPSDEELVDNIQQASIASEVQEWFNGIMEAAEVTVNEEYGTWQSAPPSVIPPSQGSTSTTTGE